MNGVKNKVAEAFERNLPIALKVSHTINNNPELAFEEHSTSKLLIETLQDHGFTIDHGVCDLPTAFTATFGSGPLVIGICAEMDALPGIGHGCGHNVIAASAIGCALALAPFADELGITLRILGTPAEESGTGKELMVNRGAFDDIHAALMIHPSLKDVAAPYFRASRSWKITFTGRGGHASRPWSALNASDATVIALTSIGLLRQQLKDGILVHHVVKESGGAVNVIPDQSVVECMIRCNTIDEVDEVWPRVNACFDAGALASGTSVRVEALPSIYREFDHNDDLVAIFKRNAISVGRTFPDYADALFGSTDMGNVSQVVPAIHPMLSFDLPAEQGNHTAAFAAAAGGPEGDRFVQEGGAAMALTVVDIASSHVTRDRLMANRPKSRPV
ncbi:M20 family metallopeptidase [Brevibacterium sp. RIT 803]|uniref:M20 family metallopeptidase n=1 Tax=Brevibacterium sp. RIT 803 TaxID=2810210 RepID=UPI00194F8C63|nr:M20 family metallopeptidase [Brevibacterium sp. RIT 803]MBM6590847.1 M20 family metallopeptidase [Brevibacterium sp. RIT 803]